MVEKIKISMVSFLNTLPFRYALNYNKDIKPTIDLTEDIPSRCAEKLLNNRVDVGLVPVAIIPQIPNSTIISNYCIGAKQQVDSVFLFADVPLADIKTVMLDYRSRTSIKLVQVLTQHFWRVSPRFVNANLGYEKQISNSVAAVVIGDKALELNGKFKYQYDLAQAWYNFTGNEFVFAAWVSTRELPQEFLSQFNSTLQFGVNNIDKAIAQYSHLYPNLPVEHYLQNSIDYNWNTSKRKSLKQFLNYL